MVAQPHNAKSIDIATIVVATMRKLGISPLPRNYELVYEFLNSSNAALKKELNALGRFPTQVQLDQIGKKFVPGHHRTSVVDKAHRHTSDELQGLIRLLGHEQATLQNYARLLEQSGVDASNRNVANAEGLMGIIQAVSVATRDTIEKGAIAVSNIVDHGDILEQLKSELHEYKRLANIDTITGLPNRRAFDENLFAIYDVKQVIRQDALVIADIDNFKEFNDRFGHPVGDQVLKVVAATVRNAVRSEDFVARTGGEEFAVILHDTSLPLIIEIAERIRIAIESMALKDQRNGQDYGRITMSFGLCLAIEAGSAADLYSKADMALYAAKSAGRNQVKVHSPEVTREMARG
tara:strand:- start:7760 stop:8809 length:1050 start_codon:yes stop_codon:yes gene_type:complete